MPVECNSLLLSLLRLPLFYYSLVRVVQLSEDFWLWLGKDTMGFDLLEFKMCASSLEVSTPHVLRLNTKGVP